MGIAGIIIATLLVLYDADLCASSKTGFSGSASIEAWVSNAHKLHAVILISWEHDTEHDTYSEVVSRELALLSEAYEMFWEHLKDADGPMPLQWTEWNGYTKMGNPAISRKWLYNQDDGHGRTALSYASEKLYQSLVLFDSTADNFGAYLCCPMSCDWTTDPNHEEADLRNDRMRHFCWSDEDDMSSASSNNQESLFDYSPSDSDIATTIDSSAVRHELTYTNIEYMLVVLKAERGKCLEDLRGFDAALETLDQSANSKLPESEIGFNRACVNNVSLL